MTTSKRKSPKPRQTPAADQPNLARIHDLTSFAAVSIPHELRQILGEEEYERHIKEIESYELVMVIRVPKDVVYLRSRVVAVPLGGQKQVQVPDPQVSKAGKVEPKAAVASTPKTPTKSARKTRGQA